jgi:hypothetical protein
MNLSGKQYWSIKLSNHSKMYIASLSKAFVFIVLIVYLFYPPAAKRGKTKRIYILMFLVLLLLSNFVPSSFFDVIRTL